MKTMMILRLLFAGTGIVLLVLSFLSYARQRLTEGMGLIWGFFSLLLIAVGVFPGLLGLTEGHAALLVCLLGLLLIFLLFKISMEVSVLAMKNQELAMQVSLLNQENERILHELGILTDEKKDTVRD